MGGVKFKLRKPEDLVSGWESSKPSKLKTINEPVRFSADNFKNDADSSFQRCLCVQILTGAKRRRQHHSEKRAVFRKYQHVRIDFFF